MKLKLARNCIEIYYGGCIERYNIIRIYYHYWHDYRVIQT